MWLNWERGKAKGRFKNVPTFTRYVASNGYRVGMDDGTPLAGAIKGYDALSPREQVVAVLDTTEPRLRSELPQHLRERLEELLDRPGLLARSPMLGQARTPLVSRVNAMLAYEVADYQEFEAVMRVVEQPASRGSIGEMVAQRFFLEAQTGSDALRKPYFPGSWYDDKNSSQPDRLRPLSRRTLDIKVGYGESDIDDLQLARYVKLTKISQINPAQAEPGSDSEQTRQALRDALLELGVKNGHLTGHDLLFLSDGGKANTGEAARRAFQVVVNKGLEDQVAIYYVDVDNSLSAASKSVPGDMTNFAVFRLEYDEEADDPNTPIARRIGSRLPD